MPKLPHALNCIVCPQLEVSVSCFSVEVNGPHSTAIQLHALDPAGPSISWMLDVMSTVKYHKAKCFFEVRFVENPNSVRSMLSVTNFAGCPNSNKFNIKISAET